MAYGGDINANDLMTALLAGESITIPVIDLNDAVYTVPGDSNSAMYQPLVRITNEELTSRTVGGNGTFDAIMDGYKVQLKDEYDAGRITGAEYTKAFVSLAESAMTNAVQFLLGRDGAFWAAVRAQADAITARVNLATAKVQYAAIQLEALTSRANYALTKLKLSTEEVTFAQGRFQYENILPLQKTQLELQVAGQTSQNSILTFQLTTMMPAQLLLTQEQTQAQRAQTTNTRIDGITPISGLLGKQKDLYTQQIVSYQRDAEIKAAKIFTDAYTVMKTINEGLDVPTEFQELSLNAILTDIKANNNLG